MRPFFTGLLLLCAPLWAAERKTISLNGQWDIVDSVQAEKPPTQYGHMAPVPGLAHSAQPPFAGVDLFESRQLIQNRVSRGMLPKSALVTNAGVSRQERNWFWYRRQFQIDAPAEVATLRINKAQFGAAVWVNGKKIGEHLPCFSAAIFDVSAALKTGVNELVVRVGAHPGVLPANVSAGTDFEKNRWTPGIYDSVSLTLSGGAAIESVQVAPRLATSSIDVQTVVRNHAAKALTISLAQRVHAWRESAEAGRARPLKLTLAAGETRTVLQSVPLPNAKLWTPEEPNLYVVESSTGSDSASTRFGMREIRFDTPTRRAYLNGRVYFLRGSNITLHRFFEDPLSGTLPWNEAWVRKLLIEIPKQMHWNSFRFCIGPVPEQWLDIADEAGLLIQNEYFVWTGNNWHGAANQVRFDVDELTGEYKEWMRDNWNHPSVAIWDANNETFDPVFGDKIIPTVRGLDLSGRAWENSYNPPAGPDDPVEDHPYEFYEMGEGKGKFDMRTFENAGGKAPGAATGHAMILNEYGWLWVNRDGTPAELTKTLYPQLLGPNATAEQRIDLDAYLLGGITEYWRAYRFYAGVLHFVYLMSSDPQGYTADHFRDIERLELHSPFRDYMSNAFAPLGVYLSFWQPSLQAGATRQYQVMLVNDEPAEARGQMTLEWVDARGTAVQRQQTPVQVAALGQQTFYVDLASPQAVGKYELRAVVDGAGARFGCPVQSRRRVTIVSAAGSGH